MIGFNRTPMADEMAAYDVSGRLFCHCGNVCMKVMCL